MITSSQQAAWEPFFRIEELAAGVYAAIVVPGSGAWANAGIVDLGDRVVIFDTFGTPVAATALRDAAERLTGRRVAHVVNSHAHYDHFHGNQVFADCDIIATGPTRDGIATAGAAFAATARADTDFLAPLVRRLAEETESAWRAELANDLAEQRHLFAALPTLAITPPNLTFRERLTLHGPRRAAEIVAFAGGHTASDTCLFLPDAAVAFVGDLLAVRVHPMLRGGDPGTLIGILDQLASSPCRTVVPGHGAVGTGDDIRSNRRYVMDIRRLAHGLRSRHTARDRAMRSPPPAPYEDWQARHAYAANIRFLTNEPAVARSASDNAACEH